MLKHLWGFGPHGVFCKEFLGFMNNFCMSCLWKHLCIVMIRHCRFPRSLLTFSYFLLLSGPASIIVYENFLQKLINYLGLILMFVVAWILSLICLSSVASLWLTVCLWCSFVASLLLAERAHCIISIYLCFGTLLFLGCCWSSFWCVIIKYPADNCEEAIKHMFKSSHQLLVYVATEKIKVWVTVLSGNTATLVMDSGFL